MMTPEQTITYLYNLYKEPFTGYLLKNNAVEQEVVEDIYQESFWALYESIRAGRIQKPGALRSYLFSTGHNKLMKHFKQQRELPQTILADLPEFAADEDSPEWIQQQEIVYKVVTGMSGNCDKVLTLYYWERKSMQEIAEYMGYAGAPSAKNKKSHCKKALIAQIIKIFHKEGWTMKPVKK